MFTPSELVDTPLRKLQGDFRIVCRNPSVIRDRMRSCKWTSSK